MLGYLERTALKARRLRVIAIDRVHREGALQQFLLLQWLPSMQPSGCSAVAVQEGRAVPPGTWETCRNGRRIWACSSEAQMLLGYFTPQQLP